MDTKVVDSTKNARQLIKMGYKIIDIKPHKNDDKRTVFVFESNEKFFEDLKRLLRV